MDELIEELKRKREEMGLSIQDLFQRTRINADFLEALEAGNFDVLPEAYVKLFLKRYAQEVKLDGDEVVRKFERLQWKQKASDEPAVPVHEEDGTPGWVIGIGGALAVAAVAAVFVWRSEPPPPPDVRAVTATRTQPEMARPEPVSTEPAARVETPPTQPDPEPVAPPPEPASLDAPPAPATTAETPALDEAAPPPDDQPSPVADTDTAPATPPAAEPSEPEPGPPAASTASEPVAGATAPEAEPEDEAETERVVSAYSLSLRQDLTRVQGGLTLAARGLEQTRVAVTSDGELIFDGLVEAGRQTAWEAKDRFLIEIRDGAGIQLRLQDEPLPRVGEEGNKVRLFISRSSIWVEEIESPGLAASPAASP